MILFFDVETTGLPTRRQAHYSDLSISTTAADNSDKASALFWRIMDWAEPNPHFNPTFLN